MSEQTKEKASKKTKVLKTLGIILLAGVVIGSLIWGIWSYRLYLKTKQELTNLSSLNQQPQLSEQQVQEILDKVRRHMLIPENEEAVIATITDIEALIAEQPFYTGAENGDYVVILPTSQKAIIYSPSKDLIINVGPIYMDDQAQSSTTETEIIPELESEEETEIEEEIIPTPTPTPEPDQTEETDQPAPAGE